MRWTEANLKENVEAAIRIASALLAENYLAQDRRRLIKCMELLDEANRAIDGGAWISDHAYDPQSRPAAPEPAADASRSSNLIVRDSEPLRKAS